MAWKIKTDEESKQPVFDEGKPVYINDEGKEIALDPPQMYQKIIDLGKESKQNREGRQTAEGQLVLFEGIDDLSAYKEEADKAMETVKNFNDKDWMKAEKVDRLKADMKDAHDKKIGQMSDSFSLKENDYKTNLDKKDLQIRSLMVSAKFATHPLFSGKKPKTNLPAEIAEKYFGKHFKVEEVNGDLALRAYHASGDPIYSMLQPGELAEFSEAMGIVFDNYPGKTELLKAGESGSGGKGGEGSGSDDSDDEIKKLETEYAAALEAKNSKLSISLKNKLFALRQISQGTV